MIKRKKKRRPRLPTPIPAAEALEPLLELMGGNRSRSRLADLWANWTHIVGNELGALGSPQGSHRQTLVMGADNGMQMQEIAFRAHEFLEAANSYLQCEYFTEMKVGLAKGNKNRKKNNVSSKSKEKIAVLRPSGKFLQEMDMSSPVARCYALFAGKSID